MQDHASRQRLCTATGNKGIATSNKGFTSSSKQAKSKQR